MSAVPHQMRPSTNSSRCEAGNEAACGATGSELYPATCPDPTNNGGFKCCGPNPPLRRCPSQCQYALPWHMRRSGCPGTCGGQAALAHAAIRATSAALTGPSTPTCACAHTHLLQELPSPDMAKALKGSHRVGEIRTYERTANLRRWDGGHHQQSRAHTCTLVHSFSAHIRVHARHLPTPLLAFLGSTKRLTCQEAWWCLGMVSVPSTP